MNGAGDSRQKAFKMSVKQEPLEDRLQTVDITNARPEKKKTKRVKPEKTDKKPRAPTAWDLHVKEFRASNPHMSFKDVLKAAAVTYRKAK